jgi:hypothetical protein
MILFPIISETLVLPMPPEEVFFRLQKVTRPDAEHPVPEDYRFNGVVENDRFRISRRVDAPENYLPLMAGDVEATSMGCIVFLTYRLFFSSFMFLVFWSIITLLLGVFFLVYPKEIHYALLSFGAGFTNYLLTIINFRRQRRMSREVFLRTLSE